MNNEKKNNSAIKNIFTKNYKCENYILLILSIVSIVLEILILLGILNMDGNKISNNEMAIVFIVFGVICAVISIISFKKNAKKYSTFNKFYTDYIEKGIKSKLVSKGLEYEIEESYEKKFNMITVAVKVNEGIFIWLSINNNGYTFLLDYNPYTNFDELVNDEEDEIIANILKEFEPSNEVDTEKVYSEFYKFVIENEHIANEIFEKHKDKIEYFED